jgi:hypothetical protein
MAATEPVTELDARFSDRGASTTPWAIVGELIEAAERFRITTVGVVGAK